MYVYESLRVKSNYLTQTVYMCIYVFVYVHAYVILEYYFTRGLDFNQMGIQMKTYIQLLYHIYTSNL